MTMVYSNAFWLPRQIMDTFGSIMASEHPALINAYNTVDKAHFSISSDLRTQGDCRVQLELRKIQPMYKCTPLLTANTDAQAEAQIHTLYRVRYLCKQNGFRTLQNSEFMDHYKRFVSAQHEELKFISYIPENKCLRFLRGEK